MLQDHRVRQDHVKRDDLIAACVHVIGKQAGNMGQMVVVSTAGGGG